MPTTRQFVATYIDATCPFSRFERWFYTQGQAKAWITRNAKYLIWSAIKHC